MRILLIASIMVFALDMYSQDLSKDPITKGVSTKKKYSFFGKLGLSQNHKNPILTSQSIVIHYQINDTKESSLSFYVNSNKKNKVLEFKNLDTKKQSVTLSPYQLPAGNYLYALFVNGRMVSKRELIIVN